MGQRVTDPAVLDQLNASENVEDRRPRAVTDPELLKQLNAPDEASKGYSLGPLGMATELGARGIDRAVRGVKGTLGMEPGSPRPDQPLDPYIRLPGIGESSNRGLYEAGKRAAELPRDVGTGKIDPTSDEGIRRAFEAAQLVTPGSPAMGIARRAASAAPPASEIVGAGSKGYQAAETDVGRPLVESFKETKGISNRAARDRVAAEIDQIAPGASDTLRAAEKNTAIGKTAEELEGKFKNAGSVNEGAREGTQIRRIVRNEYAEPLPPYITPEVRAAAKNVSSPGIGPRALQILSAADPSRGLGKYLQVLSVTHPAGLLQLLGQWGVGYPAGKAYDAIIRNRAATLTDLMRSEAPASQSSRVPAHNVPVSPRDDLSPLLSLYPFQQ